MAKEQRDEKPVWISRNEKDEKLTERQYKVLNLHEASVLATVWFDAMMGMKCSLGVSLFNDVGFRVWSTVVPDVETDREAVAEACRIMKLQRRGRIDIEPHVFHVKAPDFGPVLLPR